MSVGGYTPANWAFTWWCIQVVPIYCRVLNLLMLHCHYCNRINEPSVHFSQLLPLWVCLLMIRHVKQVTEMKPYTTNESNPLDTKIFPFVFIPRWNNKTNMNEKLHTDARGNYSLRVCFCASNICISQYDVIKETVFSLQRDKLTHSHISAHAVLMWWESCQRQTRNNRIITVYIWCPYSLCCIYLCLRQRIQ